MPILCAVNWCLNSSAKSENARKWAKWSCYLFVAYMCIAVGLPVVTFIFVFVINVIIMIAAGSGSKIKK
jgi:hypothetical protein